MPQVTGEVAQALGVSAQTIRTWSSRFSEHLSSEASQTGQTRYFGDEDVTVLDAVAGLRRLRLSYDQIEERLQQGVHLVLGEEEPTPEPPRDEPVRAMITMEQVQAMVSPLAAAADQWRAMAEERREELQALRDDHRQDVKALREENRRLREELAAERKPWWRRVLGR